jgi:hypothetical protein
VKGKETEDFMKKLYPLCMKEPEVVYLKEFDSCGIAANALPGRNGKKDS